MNNDKIKKKYDAFSFLHITCLAAVPGYDIRGLRSRRWR